MSDITNYVVTGMTCEHCVASVKEEVAEIPTVTDVAVDLDSGQVQITSDGVITRDQVAEAVREAGYELAS